MPLWGPRVVHGVLQIRHSKAELFRRRALIPPGHVVPLARVTGFCRCILAKRPVVGWPRPRFSVRKHLVPIFLLWDYRAATVVASRPKLDVGRSQHFERNVEMDVTKDNNFGRFVPPNKGGHKGLYGRFQHFACVPLYFCIQCGRGTGGFVHGVSFVSDPFVKLFHATKFHSVAIHWP